MKKVTIILTGVILMSIASLNANAQSNATASSEATLIIPISITKTSDLNFGTIAASATAGDVTMSELGVATAAGGVTLISGSPTTAIFTVTGEGTSALNITYPSTLILKNADDVELSLTDIATTVAANNGTFNLVSGSKIIPFSSKLNLPADAVAGVYTNADGFSVTVNYE